MKRAVLYARVSTPQQAKLYSLTYQLEQERQYATETDLTIVAELDEDKSGRNVEKRDKLEEACRLLEENQADVLVVWKFDRLHRNYVDSVLLRDRIRKAGKELHYAQTRQISQTKMRDRMPEDIMFLVGELELETIAERTAMGKLGIVRNGRFLGLGKAPYGYRKEGKGKELTIHVEPEQAAVVVLIFDWYVFGEDDIPPMNTQQIADRLSTLGLPTPLDLLPERQHLRQRKSGKWDRNTIYRILRESAYSGTFYQFKKKKLGTYVKRNPNLDERIGVPMPRIVDENTWQLAQEKLERGRELADRGALFDYLVGRRIRCECGYKMASTTSHCVWESKKSGETVDRHYSRYRCLGRTKDTIKHCDMPLLNAGAVDALVWEWVCEELANPIVLERKLKEIQTEQMSGNTMQLERLATLEAHRAEIENAIKRLAGVIARQDIPEYLSEQMLSEENQKLKLTTSEIEKLKREIETPLKDETISSLLAFSGEVRQKLTKLGEDFAGRRTIVDGLDVTVEAFRQDGEIYLRMRSILNPDGILRTLLSPLRSSENLTQKTSVVLFRVRKLNKDPGILEEGTHKFMTLAAAPRSNLL